MPPTDRTLGERAFEVAAKGYRNFRGAENLSPDVRVYMESVIDKRRDPITEKSFKPDELNAIRDVIIRRYNTIKPEIKESIATQREYAAEDLKNALKSTDPKRRAEHLQYYKETVEKIKNLTSFLSTGKLNQTVVDEGRYHNIEPNIQYEDYKDPSTIASFSLSNSASSKEAAMGQTLGRFVYDVDTQGNINIKDTYDFGGGYNPITGLKENLSRIGLTTLASPKLAARMYGFRYLPEGQGRPVNIRVNALAPPKSKAKEPTQNWFSRATNALGF
jgi:hypothetical protein